ncbi:hypothetical protein ACHQM5_001610 [Ranunculus cassubicifolius]
MGKPEGKNRGQRDKGIGVSYNGPRYKGVRMRKWGKWVAEIRLPNCRDRVWLGSYETPEKAARAYDAAVFCVRGPTAEFNFPTAPPPDVQEAKSLTHQQIQAIASRYANQAQEPRHMEGQAQMEAPTNVVMEDEHGRQQAPESCSTSTSQNPVLVDLPQGEDMDNWPPMDSTFFSETGEDFNNSFDGWF